MNGVRPPYVAVIFSSRRSASTPEDGYGAAARQMDEPAQQQPGFLAVESARNPDGFGITVSCWETVQHARDWKQVTTHLEAQRRGARDWYVDYTVRVATVERQYGPGLADQG
ncbi:antibiotic biosynthesis monooxygenase [Kocuria kalidii]|uniref:antibiotic biosynthesis monooxygenase family protein n=1 Tax=Kocuria kalidii TaxID=3376283 RepID=UPI00378B709F